MARKRARAFHVPRVCSDCPFRRTGGVRLRRARTRDLIGYALGREGARFVCHKTSGVLGPKQTDLQCAGALIFGEKNGTANQIARIMERLGYYDRDALLATPEAADVFDTRREMLAAALRR